jgi:hypothetical protein
MAYVPQGLVPTVAVIILCFFLIYYYIFEMTQLNRLLFKLLSADSSHIDGQKDGQEELLSQES